MHYYTMKCNSVVVTVGLTFSQCRDIARMLNPYDCITIEMHGDEANREWMYEYDGHVFVVKPQQNKPCATLLRCVMISHQFN